MDPKRVLMVNNHSLLLGGVENLLEAGGEFAVANVLINDLADLIDEIEQSQPDVIIIDEATSFIVEPAQLIAALDDIQDIRLIILYSRINKMGIYDKYEVPISNSNQFIAAIHLAPKRGPDGFVIS